MNPRLGGVGTGFARRVAGALALLAALSPVVRGLPMSDAGALGPPAMGRLPSAASAAMVVGITKLGEGEYDAAAGSFGRALAALGKQGHEEARMSLYAVRFTALVAAARLDDATEMLKEAYGFFKRTRGKDHRDTAKILMLVVGLAELRNQFEKAEGMLERCLGAFASESGEDLVLRRLILVDLAAMLEIRGQAAEGLKRLEAVLPPDPVADTDLALVSCLVAQRSRLLFRLGRRDEALAAARMARALVDQAPPLGSPLRPSALGVTADAFLRLGDLEAAASLMERSLASRVAIPGRPPGFAGSLVQASLAEVQALLGNHERAAVLLREGRAVVAKTLGRESPVAALADHAMALVLEHQGQAEQARGLAAEAAERLEKLLGKDYPDALRARATATRLGAAP